MRVFVIVSVEILMVNLFNLLGEDLDDVLIIWLLVFLIWEDELYEGRGCLECIRFFLGWMIY